MNKNRSLDYFVSQTMLENSVENTDKLKNKQNDLCKSSSAAQFYQFEKFIYVILLTTFCTMANNIEK